MKTVIRSAFTSQQCTKWINHFIINGIDGDSNSDHQANYLTHKKKFSDHKLKLQIDKVMNNHKNIFNNVIYDHISDNFTYVKYYENGYVLPHYDKYSYRYILEDNCIDITNLVFMAGIIYLNDTYDGGETSFWNGNSWINIDKYIGDMLIFNGNSMIHKCNKVMNGEKIILICTLVYKKC